MPPPPVVAVAASSGRDSTALLHCTLRQAAPLGVQVVALHVHHGLMPDADAWLRQVRAQARRWGAGFAHRRLLGQPAPGDSVEAWARRGRYQALAEMAQQAGCALVLLAHHRRDQAETVLLQALRGGGPAGLSAMPASALRGGITWARPWLDVPRAQIEAYLRSHRLKVADDASNGDPRHARSRLRTQVWPALERAFLHAEAALSGAAAHAQQARALADEVAALDLPLLRRGAQLDAAAWSALPPARRHNALRAWLALEMSGNVRDSLVERLLAELPGRRSARWPEAAGELRLYRGLLGFAPALASNAAPGPVTLDLSRPGLHPLPAWRGAFEVSPASGSDGIPAALLRDVQARARSGGERFSPAVGAVPRSLKKQFQAAAVPGWQRHGPLLHAAVNGNLTLLFVPALGIDARHAAQPGAPRLAIAWRAHAQG